MWSDGTPVTAEDYVFTLQRFTRPDYDFEWVCSMANIVNWYESGQWRTATGRAGRTKVVNDYTFTVTTDPA